ncbi:hypothetical protein BHO_0900031 (plasmid) [Borrelia hermsii YBT]|uniref:Uncharacterized protein n=1 Tax=Borrelia hermsii YBT TaxID=1313295 RepID=W5T1H1_BORHE|nr:hypothetical protein [Borrelia hermsii]AHH13080.1 hypothetical protein BHO_0900031 [Borrelia hermsii YBT]
MKTSEETIENSSSKNQNNTTKKSRSKGSTLRNRRSIKKIRGPMLDGTLSKRSRIAVTTLCWEKG